jgi:hypothetical protein
MSEPANVVYGNPLSFFFSFFVLPQQSLLSGRRQYLAVHAKLILQPGLSRFTPQIKDLERWVKPVQGEYLEKLLGDHAYRELVLLERIHPRVDNKRPAEEEVNEGGKLPKAAV